jgi:hypothetical protein
MMEVWRARPLRDICPYGREAENDGRRRKRDKRPPRDTPTAKKARMATE